ncbi:MAG: 60S ribosomal export protein NMD3 [Methanomicrobiaceae archaeon]|nr:60S ribosomal export protein NMD3 [Methanomicrobiaceae archaeon]
MDIKQNICPKCGEPSEEGLCNKCKAEEVDWITFDARVQCIHCPTCGSLRHQNTWTDCEIDRDKLIEEIALDAVHIHDDVRDLKVELSSYDPSPNRTSVRVDVHAKLYGVPVESSCRVLILWSKEQCDRCSRYSGGYYAGTIQLRAEGRKPDEYEKERAIEIANRHENELQEMGERLSFITSTDEIKEGIDIVISSHNLGELISRSIIKELGGKVTRHPKLAGQKNGRTVYRMTYLVRLPRYQKGDVFEDKGRYYEIRGTDANVIRYFDLQDGSLKISKEEPAGRMIGNVKNSESAYVNYINSDIAGILDPKTYENKECILYPWLEVLEGEEVRFLRDSDKDRIIFVG